MTPEKRERAVKWLTEEVRSLRLAPKVNGCGPENWQDQLEIMETCLEAVRDYHFPDTRKMVPLTMEKLREMDGKPVLLVFDFELEPMIALIEYSQAADCIILTNNLGGRSEFYSDNELRESGIKAYAYPPAHIDREAWVSVEEQLPEPNSGPYWVAKKKRNGEWQMKMALFCDYGYTMSRDDKTEATWRDWDYAKILNVSHWMHLPEPPKED